MRENAKSIWIATLAMLAVPIGALLVALYKRQALDDRFMVAVSRGDPGVAQSLRAQGLSFEAFCAADTAGQNAEVCSYIDNVHLFQWSAIATFLLGVAAVSLAILVPAIVGRNRNWLAWSFGPTVRVITLGVGISFCLQAVLAAYGLYTTEVQASGHYHPQIIGAVAIGGLFAGILVLRATFGIFRIQPLRLVGQRLDPLTEPDFFARLEHLAQRTDAAMPTNVVVGLEPNFFVTSAPVQLVGQSETLHGHTLYLSAPLCRVLTVQELDAVIGHEFGHFTGEDTLYSMRFAPTYRRLSEALVALFRHAGHGGLVGLMALPPASMMQFCLNRFSRAERRIGRERELLADRAGASITGPLPLATSLLKAGVYAPIWSPVIDQCVGLLDQGKAFRNVAEAFLAASKSYGAEDARGKIDDVAGGVVAHPTDTHPRTADRIEALGLSVDAITAEQILPPPSDRTSLPLRLLQTIEERLTETLNGLLIASGRATPPEPAQEHKTVGQTA